MLPKVEKEVTERKTYKLDNIVVTVTTINEKFIFAEIMNFTRNIIIIHNFEELKALMNTIHQAYEDVVNTLGS